jgi:hypothetical protein
MPQDEEDQFSMGQAEKITRLKSGRKQIYAKILLEVESIDRKCSMHLLDRWKGWATSQRRQPVAFTDLESYLSFRNLDVGGA